MKYISVQKVISGIIVLLIVIRPILNLTPEYSFFKLKGYPVSILSLWSGVYLFFIVLRGLLPPKVNKTLKIIVIIYVYYISTFGLLHLSQYGNIFKNYLYQILVIFTILNSYKIISDFNLLKISKYIYYSSIVLIILHSTSYFWSPWYKGFNEIGSYLGAFRSKHLTAISFLVLIPYNIYYIIYKKELNRSRVVNYIVLLLNLFYLMYSFQRVSIITLFFSILLYLLFRKKYSYIFYYVIIMVLLLYIIPSENVNKFIKAKIISEYSEYEEGDFYKLGAGRFALMATGIYIYENKMDFTEKIFGLGLGYSNVLHYLVSGRFAYAHIQLLQLLIDEGIFGVLIILLLAIVIIKNKYKLLINNYNQFNLLSLIITLVYFLQFFYAMPLMDGGTYTLWALWLFTARSFQK